MFEEDKDIIHQLRQENTRFALIYLEHQQLDQQINRLAKNPVTCHQEDLESLKKHKLKLKDEIYNLIKLAKQKTQ
jgi:uncharacterized protein YdcH (DUF465 family)